MEVRQLLSRQLKEASVIPGKSIPAHSQKLRLKSSPENDYLFLVILKTNASLKKFFNHT